MLDRKIKRKKFSSPTKQKVLLLLAAGAARGVIRAPRRQMYILKSLPREWRKIERRYLYRILHEFHHERLVSYQERQDGTINVVLTEEGRERTLQFKIDGLTIAKPPRWDGVWRVVFSDIPEKKRRARDALRYKLRELGFYQWQKSVFIYPYPCRDEIDFIIEFFEMRPYVRFGELLHPTNETELKLYFNL